ncbi:MAG: choice-of-anchor L domain-containing protein [Bacteroidetes bacterium]|nr:choice-of-anchor L domain-containing protein [Bacteroidota bacterium]
MKRIYVLVLLFISSVLISNKLSAQLLVDNSLTAQQLAQLISGQGVQILNPQVHCAATGYGKYNATNSNLNITEGLLLTTGTINNAIGPNNVGNKTTYFGAQNTPSTYPLLNSYTGRTTWEYCEFEFDIVPQGDTIKFDFVFASEEYEEWVDSQYVIQ